MALSARVRVCASMCARHVCACVSVSVRARVPGVHSVLCTMRVLRSTQSKCGCTGGKGAPSSAQCPSWLWPAPSAKQNKKEISWPGRRKSVPPRDLYSADLAGPCFEPPSMGL